MSHHTDPSESSEATLHCYDPEDVSHDGVLSPHGREVNHDLNQPFEAAAQKFVAGPYYASVDEVCEDLSPTDPEVAGEVADPQKADELHVDRRDFLKMFSVAALAGASSCVPRPVENIMPYTDQPVDTVPGVTKSYATTCGECSVGCGVEVKTKDGRPIKLEGWKKHPINRGKLCAVGQASLQGLYHPERAQKPMIKSSSRWLESPWINVFEKIAASLAESGSSDKKIGIFTGAVSASSRSFYEMFLVRMGSHKKHLYSWEPNSLPHAMSRAHELAWQQSGIPRHRLDQAQLIVGVCSDFLTTGLSPLYQSRGFSSSMSYKAPSQEKSQKSPADKKGTKGRFVQFESSLTITGAKADKRHTIAVGSELALLLLLLESITRHAAEGDKSADIALARQIIRAQKQAIDSYTGVFTQDHLSAVDSLGLSLLNTPSCVLAGGVETVCEHATQIQLVALLCNKIIGAYDQGVLAFDEGWHPYDSGDHQIQRFLTEARELDVLFVIGADPVRSLSPEWSIQKVISSIQTVVSIQTMPSPVDQLASYLLPAHHYLESWGDEEPIAGVLSLRQPAVRPLYDTKQPQEMLMWIAAYAGQPLGYADYHEFLSQRWKSQYKRLFAQLSDEVFESSILREGWVGELSRRKIRDELIDFSAHIALPLRPALPFGHLKLLAPYDYRLGDGRFAHLPILQEIGDALATVAWDSFAAINPYTCRQFGIKRNDVIRLYASHQDRDYIEVAVFPMPGVARDGMVIHQGGGNDDVRNTIAYNLGVQPLKVVPAGADELTGEPVNWGTVKVETTSLVYRLAAMQKHNDIANRKDVFKRVGLSDLDQKIMKRRKSQKPKNLDDVPDLYPSLDKPEIYMHKQDNRARPSSFKHGEVPARSIDHRWSMSVDLSKCTGCGACMVACSLENNVPQVGRHEINLGREMFWIRLDRYFDGSVDEPGVSFQPVMCQHCNHAPCEAVCPVFATTHDPEGINAMTYNRCVGTRYCANACPYKVRRFNWWTHKFGGDFASSQPRDRTPRALNPDVTTRTRGVMEKCNFCYGRLVEAKHKAKKQAHDRGVHSVPVVDVETACEQTCPVSAISFGNLKEPTSSVSQLRRDERAYLMLGGDHDHKHYGIKTLPNVFYLSEVVHDDLMPLSMDHH